MFLCIIIATMRYGIRRVWSSSDCLVLRCVAQERFGFKNIQLIWWGSMRLSGVKKMIPIHLNVIVLYGFGSIPIDTVLVGWTSIYQLFWGSLGTRVLTHSHIVHYIPLPLILCTYIYRYVCIWGFTKKRTSQRRRNFNCQAGDPRSMRRRSRGGRDSTHFWKA